MATSLVRNYTQQTLANNTTTGSCRLEFIPEESLGPSLLICTDAADISALTSNLVSGMGFINAYSTNYTAAFRLVSCGLRISYIGSTLNAKGWVDVSYSYGSQRANTTAYVIGSTALLALTDDNVTKGEGHYCGRAFDGVELNYFPKDLADLEFSSGSDAQVGGFEVLNQVWSIYFTGLPAETSVLRCEMVRYWEYLPSPAYMDLLSPVIVNANPSDIAVAMKNTNKKADSLDSVARD